MEYFGLFLLSIIVEGVITYFKEFFINGEIKWEMAASVLLGIFVAVAYGVDLLADMGMQTNIPYVVRIRRGIIIRRDRNYVLDLVKKLTEAKKD